MGINIQQLPCPEGILIKCFEKPYLVWDARYTDVRTPNKRGSNTEFFNRHSQRGDDGRQQGKFWKK